MGSTSDNTETIRFKVFDSNPRILSVQNYTGDYDFRSRPIAYTNQQNQEISVFGFNLGDTRIRLIDTVSNRDTVIENTFYKANDRVPVTNKSCESLSFILPNNIVSKARVFKIVIENKLNINKVSRENAYMFVVNKRPLITTIRSTNPPIKANYLLNQLVISGEDFVRDAPTTIIRFNGTAIPHDAITKNEIRVRVPATLVNSGNNRLSVINPGSSIIEFTNNLLAESLSRTEFGNFGDSTTVFAEGIIPMNAQLIRPQKVVFSASSSIYDTTFFLRGSDVYRESRILYNRNYLQSTFTFNTQILNNSANVKIVRAGLDTLNIANPYFLSPTSRDTNFYLSNPIPFQAYDAALLPKADSASPRQMRPAARSMFTIHGVRFDERTLVRCTFRPLSNLSDTISPSDIIIRPQEIGQNSSDTRIVVNVPLSMTNREGVLSFQALNADTVGLKEYGRVNITNRYPVIESVTVSYERKIVTPGPLGLGNPTISYSPPEQSDSVFAGTGGENKRQRYFILRGRNFGTTPQFVSAFGTFMFPVITMNGEIIPWQQYEILSDTAISFGYSSDVVNDKFLTFQPNTYRFSITNAQFIQSETLFSKNILSPKPSINEIRRLPQRVIIPNSTNTALRGISLGYRDSLRVRIYSGGQTAPNAKNFVRGARVRMNNRSSKFDLETTFIENASGDDKYALDVTIPAFYLSAYNINSLVVVNPGTGFDDGGLSAPYYFKTSIEYPNPSIDSLTPTRIPVGTTDTLLTIRGQFFTPNTDVTVRRFDSLEYDPGIGGTYPIYGESLLPIVQRLDSTGLVVRLPAEWRSRVAVDSIVVCNPYSPGLPPVCSKAVVYVLAPPPSITATEPATLETYINGEPRRDDTLTFRGTNLNGNIRVLWNDTLALRVISAPSATSLAVFVPDSLHRVRGDVPVRFMTEDSLSSRTFVRLAYPDAVIDSVRPDTIEIASPAMMMSAFKDDASLTSDAERDFPVVAGLPTETMLYPNAPNPFSASTTLDYALPADATVSVEIYDALGRNIATLVEQKFHRAGTYSLLWSPPNSFGSGIYTTVLQSMDTKGRITRKTLRMTLIR
jgi:hypothetical protein